MDRPAEMDRRSAPVLLAVLGAGVFLAGLELMVTAVALPSILADLADPASGSAWVELRKASWIINGYLLVYILTMPMAGRLADLWGTRRLFMGALVVFTFGSALAGASQTMDQLIAARLVQAVGGGVLVPVGTAAASHLYGGRGAAARARRHRCADLPRDGRGPVVGAAILASVHPEAALAAAGIEDPLAAVLAPAWRWVFYLNVPIGIVALALAWAASPGWETPRRPGRIDVASAALYGIALVSGLIGLTLSARPRSPATAVDPARRDAGPHRSGRGRHGGRRHPRAPGARPVHRPALFRSIPFSSAAAGLAAHRLCVRDRDHRWRRLRRPRPLRRTRRAAARPRCAGWRDRGRRARVGLAGPRSCRSGCHPRRARC